MLAPSSVGDIRGTNYGVQILPGWGGIPNQTVITWETPNERLSDDSL